MTEYGGNYGAGEAAQPQVEPVEAARTEVGTLLGQVMFLVAVALGFLALGSWIGRELTEGAAMGCFFAGFGMLIVANFSERLRVGTFAVAWLYTIALLLGLGLGPALNQLFTTNPDAVTTAAGGTALATVGAGTIGFIISKDLKGWLRPLSFAILGAVGLSIVLLITGTSAPPLLSLAIIVISTGLITVYFNYLRKHATERDAVWIATGIFVAIVNIFISLLNLLSD
ncbi:MAG TPA: Bax inhibitor-1 family protein [Solirubrobacterales bacterium]|nr:Bax inhibitor-1 family protein [Solirubrobacterales bacterium]